MTAAWAVSYRLPFTPACHAYLDGLPRRLGGQCSAHSVAASACRLLFRDTTGGREIGLQRQMPRVFRAGPRTDVDLLRQERLAAFRAHHHRIEILAAEIVSVHQR